MQQGALAKEDGLSEVRTCTGFQRDINTKDKSKGL